MIERQIELRYRRPAEADIAAARKVLGTTVKEEIEALPRLAQHYAASVLAAAERAEETLTVPVQAIRVGDLAICGLPFEVLVEIGLEIREKSPFGETMVIGSPTGATVTCRIRSSTPSVATRPGWGRTRWRWTRRRS